MLLKCQKSENLNRILIIQFYINQLNNFIKATKEGSYLFKENFYSLLNLLPTSWASAINNIIIMFNRNCLCRNIFYCCI